MKNYPLLKRWIGNLEGVTNTCFECSLYCGVIHQEAPPATAKAYYGQIDWCDAGWGVSPLTVGSWLHSAMPMCEPSHSRSVASKPLTELRRG